MPQPLLQTELHLFREGSLLSNVVLMQAPPFDLEQFPHLSLFGFEADVLGTSGGLDGLTLSAYGLLHGTYLSLQH
jgi:hypothetical protein